MLLHLQLSVFPLIVFAASIVTMILFYVGVKSLKSKGDIYFVLLMAACSLYSVNYALELSFNDLATKIFYLKLQYLGAPFISPFMLLFSLSYAGYQHQIAKYKLQFLLVLPVFHMVLGLSNDWHNLMYTHFEMNNVGTVSILSTQKGLFYFIHNLYSIVISSLNVVLFLNILRTTAKAYYKQVLIIFLGFSSPYLAYVFYWFDVIPLGLDPIPISFAFTGIFLYIGLHQFNLFSIVPIAYRTLFENLSDGLILVDADKKKIVGLNKTAEIVLGVTSPDKLEKVNNELITKWPELNEVLQENEFNKSVDFFRDSNGKRTWFSVSTSIIKNEKQEVLGYFLLLRDITQDKENDFKLQENQILLSTFYDQAPMLMGVVKLLDNDIVLIKGNHITAKYFTGVSGEVSNLSFKAIGFEKLEIQKWIYEFKLSEVGKKNVTFEHIIVPKRSSKEFLFSTNLIYLGVMPDGEKRYAFISQDITEKRKAEENIVKAFELLDQTSKVAQVGGWEVLIDKNHVELTSTIREMFGVDNQFNPKPNELITFFTPQSQHTLKKHLYNLLKYAIPLDLEVEYRPENRDESLWLRVIANAEQHAGITTRLYGIAQNITQQKKNVIELKAAEEKLESVFREMTDVVWSVSLPDYKMLFITPSAFDLYGIPASKWYEDISWWEKAFYWEDKYLVETIWKKLETDGIYTYQYRIQTPDGKVKWVLDKAKVIKNEIGEPIRIDGYVSDITAQVKSRDELEKARTDAIQANKAKSEFLANMSHEIRTPLNGIVGFNELLSSTDLNETQQRFVQNIRTSATSLLSIINDILDFSKVEAGKLELDIVRVNLIQLVEQALELFVNQAEQKGIELILNRAYDLPEFVYTDPIRLKQILVNLLGNAIKFTEKGEVELQVNWEKTNEKHANITISIRDTGIGVKDSEKEKLFKAFSQADSSTTRRFGGTGLGLVISNRFVQMMGSSIEFESEIGKGSRFYFTIHVLFEAYEIRKLANEFKPNRVLIVEDSATLGHILEQGLNICGIDSIRTQTNEQAIELLQSEQFDSVMLDMHLLNIQKEQWLQTLKALQAKEKLFVIWMANHAQLHQIEVFEKEIKHTSRLYKPVKFNDIRTVFEQSFNKDIGNTQTDTLAIQKTTKSLKTKRYVNILIVEDVEVNRLLIRTYVTKMLENVVIYEAINGQEAVKMYQANPIDLILMDIQMPVMDGLEATRHIRKLEQNRAIHTPIVALTAGALQQEKEKAYQAGLDVFITKPVDYSELFDIVQNQFKQLDVLVDISKKKEELLHFNTAAFRQRMMENEDLMNLSITQAQTQIPIYIHGIIEAHQANNSKELQRIAHALKGLALTLCFERLGKFAAELETKEAAQVSLDWITEFIQQEWEEICKNDLVSQRVNG